ncbi:MAG TPA: DmsE family decaheme c-type cytochrome [Burkholderiales bacterium]|nr:DmsE family decaheme c-type cytochrome [Burkholderiales bacterium]
MSEFRRYVLGLVAAIVAAGLLGSSAPAVAGGDSQPTGKWVAGDLPALGAQAAAKTNPQVAQAPAKDEQTQAKDLILRGDAVCTRCHVPQFTPHVFEIAKTKMGTTADARTPTCISCHGESLAHRDGNGLPDRTFGKTSTTPVEVRNEACLACHQNSAVMSHWAGSTHQLRNIACTSCHQVHAAHDPVLDKRTQPEVCFTCHKEQRAQANRPSHHPILEGKIVCSDCHSPMGSVGPHLLKRASVNDTCYTCHMEKRGPFVHNHDPVSDDCTTCHNPHGTVVENMLKMRPPMLCHQCHTPHGPQVLQLMNQQSLAGAGSLTSGKNAINYTMARGCVNCHTQIHGSNNPASGVPLGNPTPQFFFR